MNDTDRFARLQRLQRAGIDARQSRDALTLSHHPERAAPEDELRHAQPDRRAPHRRHRGIDP